MLNFSKSPNSNSITATDELNLFKAILIFNESTYHDSLDNEVMNYETTFESKHTPQRKSLFSYLYAQQQFTLFGEFIYLITKTKIIFDRIKKDTSLSPLIKEALNKISLESFKEWEGQHLSIINYWKDRVNLTDNCRLHLKKEYILSHMISLDNIQYTNPPPNYQLFVERPFYQKKEGEPYPLFSFIFLIKLLDNEVYFQLKKVNDQLKIVGDLKSFFSKNIIETVLFKNLILNIRY